MKNKIIHTSSTLSHTSLGLVLALAALLGFEFWTEDINQAFLQSATRLKREIFCRPKELSLGKNEFLQLMLPLYGLSESGDYSSETMTDHHILELNFEQSAMD